MTIDLATPSRKCRNLAGHDRVVGQPTPHCAANDDDPQRMERTAVGRRADENLEPFFWIGLAPAGAGALFFEKNPPRDAAVGSDPSLQQ